MTQLRDNEGSVVAGLTPTGLPAMGLDRTASVERIINVDASGNVQVVGSIVPVPPATGLQSFVVSVAAGPAVALTAPVANTIRQLVQNRSQAIGSLVLVHEVGGGAGTGVALGPLGSALFETTKALEAVNTAGPTPVDVSIQFETATGTPTPTPPANLQSNNTAVGIGATVPLTAPPANTQRQIVQNRSLSAVSLVLIREVGGTPGTGAALASLGCVTFDDTASLEVENIAGPAATIAVLQEIT